MLNEAYASRLFWKRNLMGLIARLKVVNAEGKGVVKFIKSEYHLKDK
jgi:hypothetical protein